MRIILCFLSKIVLFVTVLLAVLCVGVRLCSLASLTLFVIVTLAVYD